MGWREVTAGLGTSLWWPVLLGVIVLRALVPAADIEKMRAAGPVKTSYPLLSSPELDQVPVQL